MEVSKCTESHMMQTVVTSQLPTNSCVTMNLPLKKTTFFTGQKEKNKMLLILIIQRRYFVLMVLTVYSLPHKDAFNYANVSYCDFGCI